METNEAPTKHDGNPPQNGSSQKTARRKRLNAALASAIVPGLGQLLLGARATAYIHFSCLIAIVVLYWPTRLPITVVGFIFLVWFTILLFVVSTWNALRTKRSHYQRLSLWWLILFLPLAIFFFGLYTNGLFRAAGFRNYTMPSSSMEPTIARGSSLVADMLAYRKSKPRPYDVVIFRWANTPYVKRVIAGPGSMIEGRANEVFVDGKQLSERYVQHIGLPPRELSDFGPIQIPPGKLFVMGDNRDVSYDSRITKFGLVDVHDVLGKALYIYRPAERWWEKTIQ